MGVEELEIMVKNKEDLVQCRGLKDGTRERCKKRTRDSSGYCKPHRAQINTETEFSILKCAHCPVDDCKYRDHFTEGICYFEVSDTIKDFDEQWKVITAMREVLRNERLIIGRIEREISKRDFSKLGKEGDEITPVLKELKDFTAIHSGHMMMFGKFMGFQAIKSDDEQSKEKAEELKKLMAKEKAKDKKKKELEKEIEVEIEK